MEIRNVQIVFCDYILSIVGVSDKEGADSAAQDEPVDSLLAVLFATYVHMCEEPLKRTRMDYCSETDADKLDTRYCWESHWPLVRTSKQVLVKNKWARTYAYASFK